MTSVPAHEAGLAAEWFPDATRLAEAFSDKAVAAHADARVLCVAYSDVLAPELLARMPRLEVVVTRSDGFDHLPLDWMRARGVAGYHLGDYAVESVAHYTLAQLVGLLRRLPEGAARARALSWDRTGLAGRSLLDVTVGVLGTGRIGSRVARLLCGLGARVVGHDLVHDASLAALAGFAYARDLDDLLARSDALTVHVPLTPDTERMLDARALARLPQGAVLVNTARGRIVDQAAVEAALRRGALAGYAADVMPGEPAPPDLARFADLPNVALTPHLAAYDARTIRERYARAAAIARAHAEGRADDVAAWRVV